jgi:hypothetical protein
MAREAEEETRKSDGAIAWVLVAIWLSGVVFVRVTREDIPLTMLIIGTAFFVVLIPAMKEIARSLDRFFASHFSDKAN